MVGLVINKTAKLMATIIRSFNSRFHYEWLLEYADFLIALFHALNPFGIVNYGI